MQAASGRKTECRRRRARRASALMVVLALLFTMVPTGFATVAGVLLMGLAAMLCRKKQVEQATPPLRSHKQ